MTLPDGYVVRRSGNHWAIAGRTGLFLVARQGDSAETSAQHAILAAHRLRARLAERIDVVPFVDPVVVSATPGEVQDCALVEPDLLESFLVVGPTVISEGELALLRHHLPAAVAIIEADGGF
ncbi:MAG: hypothetical protein ACK5O2_00315 [Microthrixaceae bacterium]